MIIGWDDGHTIAGVNYGAVGIEKESEQTRILGKKVREELIKLGHTVINCTVDQAETNVDSLIKRVEKANKQNLDIFISLHFNASKDNKGNGAEILTYAAKQLIEANRVLNNLNKIGFVNRGIKDGTNKVVIKKTKVKSMLIEVCFIDNIKDVTLYKNNIDKVAKAIAEGITGQEIKTTPQNATRKPIYDENPPQGANILQGCKKAYIEETSDNRLIIHMDRGNYITLGKGECKIYLNDNKGNSKVHKFGL